MSHLYHKRNSHLHYYCNLQFCDDAKTLL